MNKFLKKTAAFFAVLVLTISAACFTSACNGLPSLGGNSASVDYPSIVNQITLDKMHGNIKIVATAKRSFGFWVQDEVSWQGSGIIFSEDENCYYALTNNHVIFNSTNYNNFTLTAVDYVGNEYSAQMLAAEAAYDLALISFRKSTTTLSVLSLASADPTVGTQIISIGQPLGQNNAVTFGKVLSYEQITVGNASEEQSDVKFPAMKHDAPTESGSSGGAILDLDLNICAIHYAGSKSDNGDFVAGYAVQATKIIEFLENTGIVKFD